MPLFNDEGVEDDFSDDGIIQVFLDNSNMQQMSLMKKELYDTYQRFMEEIMVGCRKSKKAGNVPIAFEAMYGKIDFSMRKTMGLGMILT